MPGNWNHTPGTRNQSGFTLIELMVVIVIMAMAAGLIIPRLPAREGTRLKTSARNLATGIRFLNDRAIISKGIYRLSLDLTETRVSMVRLSATGEVTAPDDQFLNRKLIEEGITIEDVTAPRLGKITEGGADIAFGPSGMSEPLIVHLKGGTGQFTIIAYPFGGKVVVLDGYQELTT